MKYTAQGIRILQVDHRLFSAWTIYFTKTVYSEASYILLYYRNH